MKALKLFNGRDWDCRGGHLYVAAYSIKDCAKLASEAYREVEGLEDRPEIEVVTVNEIRVYWSKGCWGNSMNGIAVERGVWWTPQEHGPDKEPIKRIL